MSKVWVSLEEASTLREMPFTVLMAVIRETLDGRKVVLSEEDKLWLSEAYNMFQGSAVFLPVYWDNEFRYIEEKGE